jgi:shikimate dehydrogenase
MPSSHPVLCGSIAGRPGRFGVAMHNAAYAALGLDFTYVAFGTEDTAAAVAAVRALGVRGLGVTTPHKVRIMEHLDAVDDTARAIGAVNTVVNDEGRLTGSNVDWLGALEAFRETLDPAGRRAAVIGAGGGARAIVYGLVGTGCAVTLYNRTADRGRALAEAMGCAFGGDPQALAEAESFDLLVHATAVGHGDADAMLPPPAALRPPTVVFDAVTEPVETRLLREARARGCRCIPGIRMQLHQAVHQFFLYTGRAAPFAVMERALLASAGATPAPARQT